MGEGTGQKQLLLSICGRRVTDAQQVIDLLMYETVDSHFSASTDIVITTEDIDIVKDLIARYLLGAGHPMHENWGYEHIDLTAREKVAGDYLMRARRLLLMVTGSELLPSNRAHRIYVCPLNSKCHHVYTNFGNRFNLYINFLMNTFIFLKIPLLAGQYVLFFFLLFCQTDRKFQFSLTRLLSQFFSEHVQEHWSFL